MFLKYIVNLPNYVKSNTVKMFFAEKIRQLREEKQLLQRQVSAVLEIDNALYCKIERGDRFAKREQVPVIAKILQSDSEELLVLWLADKIITAIGEEKELGNKAIEVTLMNINR